MEDSLESLGDGRGQPRPAAPDRPERLHPQVVRHPRRRSSTCWARRSPTSRTTYEHGRGPGRHRDGPGDQREPRAVAGELADPAAGQVSRERGREDGPDVPLRDQRHRRHGLRRPVPRGRRTRSTSTTLNELYVLVNFRPAVTNKNWRMDCGVAGYDNTFGLPPFFPTRLRFEDYIYRLWIQQDGIAAAHVDAAQNHTKTNYMRNPVAAEIFNEEVSNLLKRKIKASVPRVDELSIAFDYEGEVTAEDAERDPRQDRRDARPDAGGRRATRRTSERRTRCGSSPATCRRRSTASSRTSSSRTCCGSWTTWSATSRARSSSGRPWSRSATSASRAASCPRRGWPTRRRSEAAVEF